jgi:hypothetical protein
VAPAVIPDLLLLSQDTTAVDGSYPVYYGPGDLYSAVPNTTLTGGPIKVFGKVGDWALIAYDLSGESYRVGYVAITSIPSGISVQDRVVGTAQMTTKDSAVFTDNPTANAIPLFVYADGQPVTVLATMGNWTYVEVANYMDTGLPARGFIDSSMLK